MSHLDRYVFKRCLMVFAFFTLVFALAKWINRAVTLFNGLATNGHSAKVFSEFSVLALPTVLSMVVTASAFAALYAAVFTRFGSGRFIAFAIFLLVILKLVESVVTELARTNLDLWYLVYAPFVVGLIMFWVLMYLSIDPNVLRKQNNLSGQNT